MAMHAFRSRHRPPGPALAPPGAPIPLLDQRSPGRGLQPTTFRWLAVLATIFAYAQISLGAAVRVSGSGLGCGNDWPLCHGHIVPPLNTQAIVEYAHRTVGSLTGVLLIVTVAVGWLTFRRSRPFVIGLVTAAAGLIVLEGLLGALVVFTDLAGGVRPGYQCLERQSTYAHHAGCSRSCHRPGWKDLCHGRTRQR